MKQTNESTESTQVKWVVGLENPPAQSASLALCNWLERRAHGSAIDPTWMTLTELSPTGSSLAELAENRDAAGLIVTRRARSDELAFVRLGETARHLVHDPDRPVIVVPPELEEQDVPAGPVVAAVSPRPEDIAVARYASHVATLARRPLHLVHVRSMVLPIALAEPALAAIKGGPVPSDVDTWLARLESWAHTFGLAHARCSVVVRPGVVQALLHYAQRNDACMLVAGGASRGPIERLLLPDPAANLAARAARPVAVVPQGTTWN